MNARIGTGGGIVEARVRRRRPAIRGRLAWLASACALVACGGGAGDPTSIENSSLVGPGGASASDGGGGEGDASVRLTFPSPPGKNVPFPWAFYDVLDHGAVYEKVAPQAYLEFGAEAEQSFAFTVTAMVSVTDWQPDPTKHIDAALFEGVQKSGVWVFTQVARAFSYKGVISIGATSTNSKAIHVLGVEASPASYGDGGLSPEVPFQFSLQCSSGPHQRCAGGGQPGDDCTISPETCDVGPEWCFSPPGACGNTGSCMRLDTACSPLQDPVCLCNGSTQTNICIAQHDHEQVRSSGACP